MIAMSLSEVAAVVDAKLHGDDAKFIGCSTDSRTIEADNLFIALAGDNYDGHNYIADVNDISAGAMVSTVNDELKPCLEVADTLIAMGQLAKHWRSQMSLPLVAVTGSNGKTTVKDMIHNILAVQAPVCATSGNLNNDIGVPLTLFGLDHQHQYAVIEMGASHPKEIAWLSHISQPNVAVITLCAPAHLEGFGDVAGVANAKAEIFHGLQKDGVAVINANDQFADVWRDKASDYQQISFGIAGDQLKNIDVTATSIQFDTKTQSNVFCLHYADQSIEIILPLLGHHNVMNALAATAACLSLGTELAQIKTGLESMVSPPSRLQLKKGKHHSLILDDTYNANPNSLNVAIVVLSQYDCKRILVLGDMGELGADADVLHQQAGQQAKDLGIHHLFTLGDLSQSASGAFGDQAQHYTDRLALINDLIATLKHDQQAVVLVKGSRFMQMEDVINALTTEQH